MLKGVRIAILSPEEREQGAFMGLFERLDCSVKLAPTPAVARVYAQESGIDCLIVPHRLTGGISGVSACIQIRACEILSGIPVLALIPGRDKGSLQSFYSAGADVVMIGPHDGETVGLQVAALARQTRAFTEKIEQHVESLSLSSAVIDALNLSREGLIIFDSAERPLFISESARRLLALSGTSSDPALIHELYSFARRTNGATKQGQGIRIGEATITRSDGTTFLSEVRSIDLLGPSLVTVGTAVSFSDLSEILSLDRVITQFERGSALGLVGAAAIFTLFGAAPPRSAIAALDSSFQQSTAQCDLNAALSYTVDILDSVLDEDMSMRVSGSETGIILACRATDVIQILGHMLMHLTGHGAAHGEITISIDNSNNDYCSVIISGEHPIVETTVPDDRISDLVRGTLNRKSVSPNGEKLTYGLAAAQIIADRYGIEIEMKDRASAKLRVKFPK